MLVAALVAGVLIGCVGIGGVLLTPALVYVGGLGFHLAAATSMWAFLFAGAAGTLSYSGRGSIDWRLAAWVGAGVVPTAVGGAWANVALPEGLLMALLAALMVASGADALLGGKAVERGGRRFGASALLAVGALVGFGSALTGTGGAVLLVPVLLLLRAPVLAAVGAAQAVALPVVAFSTVGYVLYGSVDFVLGTAVGLVAAAGVVVGARIAHAAPAAKLRRVVAAALLCAGLLIAAQTAWGTLLGDAAGPGPVRQTQTRPARGGRSPIGFSDNRVPPTGRGVCGEVRSHRVIPAVSSPEPGPHARPRPPLPWLPPTWISPSSRHAV